MAFVLDASVALSWCFDDEKFVLSEQLLDELAAETQRAVVPELWPLEISNILMMAERQKRISYTAVIQSMERLAELPIDIDNETSLKAFHEIASLAYSEKITIYDAAYLELAVRRNIPLATKDRVLAKAAERLGIVVLK